MKTEKNAVTELMRKCFTCGGACCKYITVKMDTPRSILDFDNLLWQVLHEKIHLMKDADGWFLLINNPCVKLGHDGKCTDYDRRPVACRDHSAESCEYDDPIDEESELYFHDAESLTAYCRERFKTWDKRHQSL